MTTTGAPYDLHEATASGSGYIPGLDGLRAVSVLLVMFAHYGFGKIVPGGLGVTIFFFISGMLITTLLLIEGDRAGRIDFPRFYLRRLSRLMPELLVFLLATSLLALALGEPVETMKFLSALFYFYNYYSLFFEHPHSGAVIWPHLWSLSIEEHFYILYPLALLLLFHRPKALLAVLCTIFAAPLAWRFYVMGHDFPFEYTYRATEARIDSIAYGCLFALAVRYFPGALAWMRRWGGALLVAGAVALAGTLLIRATLPRETIRYTIQGFALFGIFCGLYCWRGNALLLRLLEFAPLRWMGRVSYSAYLWHFIPIHIFGLMTAIWYPEKLAYAQRLPLAIVMTAATFALAGLSFNLVLRPFGRLRRRFGSHTIH